MSVAARNVRRARDLYDSLPYGPRTHPCVCRAGIHEHSGAARTGGCKRTGCKRYRADAAYDLAYRAQDAAHTKLGHSLRDADDLERRAHYAANPRKYGEWSIGASDTSTCPRKIQYRNKPPHVFEDDGEGSCVVCAQAESDDWNHPSEEFVRDPEDKREARMGTIIHAEVTRRMRLIYPWREFAGRIQIPGLDRESEFDSYDPITGEVEDYKTAGDWRWDVLGDEGPDESVWEQVMLYAYALVAMGRWVSTVKISYIKRCNGHDETFIRPYDEQMAKRALDRLLGYATSLDLGIDLPRTGTGPSNDALCRRCFARSHCWSIPAAERAGRSPESYTILGPEPVDETIVWAIGERVEAGSNRLDWEKREKAAKGLLDGIEPGRYGDYEGYYSGGGGGNDPYARVRQLEEFFDLPDDERPPLEALPAPQKHKYRYVKWGRVRKATLQAEARARRAAENGDGE